MDSVVLSEALRASISPVVLISGFGLILIVMTNRLGRAIDRTWHISERIKSASANEKSLYVEQLRLLSRRNHMLKVAVGFNGFGILCISMIILLLFAAQTMNLDCTILIKGLFLASMFSLMASIIIFLYDVSLTLKSLEIEIKEHLK